MKQRGRRALSILLTLCLLAGLPVGLVTPAAAADYDLPSSGGTLEVGTYSLSDDVTLLQSNLTVTGDVTINLNGHTLKGNGGSVITVASGGTLTLTATSGGTITGGNSATGGGLSVQSGGVLKVAGAPNINSNTGSNVYLTDGAVITDTGLTGGSIGVTVEHPPALGQSVPVVNSTASNKAYFTSDNPSYELTVSENSLVLTAKNTDPSGHVTRADLAVGIYNKFLQGMAGPDQGFTDLDSCTAEQRNAINALAHAGYVSGTSPTTFHPAGTVTRAEGAVVLWKATGSKSNPDAAQVGYKDVNIGDWYTPAIHYLTAIGVLTGTGGGEFGPNEPLTQQMLTALLARCDNIDTGNFAPGVTRVEMVLAAYETFKGGPLEAKLSGSYTTQLQDLDICTAEEQRVILFFEELGMVKGYTDGNFWPYAPASNLQIAMFLQRCAQLNAQTGTLSTAEGEGSASAASPLSMAGSTQDTIDEAFAFLAGLGVDVADAKNNPNAPGTVTRLTSWNQALRPAAPVFTPAGGTYSSAQSVTLRGPDGLTIYYTTDGRDPTMNSVPYTGALAVRATTTVKAVTIGTNGAVSDVASATYTIGSSNGGSSGGGGGTGGGTTGNQTNTTTNPDGSTTTTVTNGSTGTVTETTKYPDGSQEVVKTEKDGTVTTTTTDTLGNQTQTVELPDGSVSTTVEQADGSTSTTVVAADGAVTAQAGLSASALAAAGSDAVTLPMSALPASADRAPAPTLTLDLPAGSPSARVEIPVENVTPGTVAVLVKADGTEAVIPTSLTTRNGVAVTLRDGDTVKIVDNAKSFADVPDSHWGSEAVAFASSREIFSGTGADVFSPEMPMSRAMIVTVLARMEGVDTSTGANWYDAGAQWAVEQGISDGTNLDQPLTREQLVTMLYRYVGQPGTTGSLSDFPDGGQVSDYAAQAMAWAVEIGLIGGNGAGALNPQGEASRAEVAAILQRFVTARNS